MCATRRFRISAAKVLWTLALVAGLLARGEEPTTGVALAAAEVALTNDSVRALALEWFGRMQTGQIDRSQLAAGYDAQLSDGAAQGMAKYMKDHDYGAPPLDAQIVKTRASGGQRFYVVKLVFPRGDAASLLMGFNAEGKITGISLMSLAGD
jgi:hypothetical protein